MFRSATLRLTGWYLLTLMLFSVIFSVIIFQVATNELGARLERLETSFEGSSNINPNQQPGRPLTLATLRLIEQDKASTNLSVELLYINLFVLVIAGFGSYFFARRSLAPIEKAHEAQSRFTSDASHELRTPLAVMKTELEVALRDKNATSETLKEVLSSNLEEVDKLTQLSEMLLSLSRLDSVKLKLGSVNLNKITKDILKKYKLSANRVSIKAKGQQIVHGNETAIADLIKVLVDNALQYSPNESTIEVSIDKQDQSALFEIRNSGQGISPEKLPYIFDRFYRADSSRTSGEHKGYGLGLALAKSIVDIHDGELKVSSTPNEETTFTLLLPLNSGNQSKG
ncbi:MAG: HAMP domain-containing sensor histidine kinase [Candidatus Saccharibacteria bacterium]|nr:HAMP domain-containing sensor histidine kinase [Candidatus Saccharibacteria bacterium]